MVDLRDRYFRKLDAIEDSLNDIEAKVDELSLTLARDYATRSESNTAKRWAISAVVASMAAFGAVLQAL